MIENPRVGQNVLLTEEKIKSLSAEDKKKIWGRGLIVLKIEGENVLLVFRDRKGGMLVKKKDIDPAIA